MHLAEDIAEALLSDYEDEVLWDHRLQKRVLGYFAVLWSDDYLYVRCSEPTSDILVGPDPASRILSKRGWELQMQNWRKVLAALRRRIEREQ